MPRGGARQPRKSMKYITPQFAAFLTLMLMVTVVFLALRNAFGG